MNISPTSMKGSGYYNEHSQIQHQVIDRTLLYIKDTALHIPLPEQSQEPFVVIDYGCSEGRNSIAAINYIIQAIQARKPKQDFMVIHNDLPNNNFNSLMQEVHVKNEQSYMNMNIPGHIFSLASGTSFYKQIMPDHSVHFGFSASALHWLSKLPTGSVKNHIFPWASSAAEIAKIAKLAEDDWLTILKHRANELKSGGRLLVTMAANPTPSDYEHLNISVEEHTPYIQKTNILLNDILQEMGKEGLIAQSNLENLVIPIYLRTLNELLAPIKNEDAPFFHIFDIQHAFLSYIKCPYTALYKKSGDAKTLACELTATIRAFTEPMVKAGIAYHLSELEASNLMNDVYNKMEGRIYNSPESHPFNLVYAFLVLARK